MKRHNIFLQIILACLCLAVVANVVWQYRSKCSSTRIPLTIMKETGFLTTKAHVNGKEIVMIVDTGANTTIFDIGLIEELQLTNAKNSGVSFSLLNIKPLKAAYVKEFKVGHLSYYGDFPFADLTRVNRGLADTGEWTIRGLLGADILIKWNAAIDYKDTVLVIRNR